jgi:DNA-binding protein YbaB
MDGRAWLAAYEERLQDVGDRAERAQRALAGVAATVTSDDGAVTVTVNPAGAMQALVLAEAAGGLTRERLAATVLGTARLAQAEAARLAAAAVAPLLGEGSEAMAVFRTHLPTEADGR